MIFILKIFNDPKFLGLSSLICFIFDASLIIKQSKVPVIIDAGIGTASEVSLAMELGCDAVLLNTAIARAKDPVMMAEAMRDAAVAGRKAFLAGRIPKNELGAPSSPEKGRVNS